MADDDDQGTSSGSRPKLLLPKAPGPAQPLSHAASRHRKKLDAALSAGGYYDVAHALFLHCGATRPGAISTIFVLVSSWVLPFLCLCRGAFGQLLAFGSHSLLDVTTLSSATTCPVLLPCDPVTAL